MAIPVLNGPRIVLGVTGSIACYKALDLASKLKQAGALVDVIMTPSAAHFVTPLAFRSITHRPVTTDLFDPNSELSVNHVALAQAAELMIVAPATANTIAKMALGLTDNALTATYAATAAPALVAPAMDGNMYKHPAIQQNLRLLRERGVRIVGPESGYLASGTPGVGRMTEPAVLMGHGRLLLGRGGDMAGRSLVVSAGGTQEPLDPVRTLTNRSSGKMGYAVAQAALDRGAAVTLVSAPTALPRPVGAEFVPVTTALDMQGAVQEAAVQADGLIMAAAVSDYRAAEVSGQKMKKTDRRLSLELVPNPDILAEVGGTVVKVGFAAESQDLIAHARQKLSAKGLDLIVANDITDPEGGFGSDTNRAVILGRDGSERRLPLLSKDALAHELLDLVRDLLDGRGGVAEDK